MIFKLENSLPKSFQLFEGSSNNYEVKSVHSLKEVSDFVSSLTSLNTKHALTYVVSNDRVKARHKIRDVLSVRSQNLYKGTECLACKRKLDHFRLETYGHGTHFNGYSYDGIQLTCDHITPKSAGGPDVLENVQMLCEICNSNKGSETMDSFMSKLDLQTYSIQASVDKFKISREKDFLSILKICNSYNLKRQEGVTHISRTLISSNFEAKSRANSLVKRLRKQHFSARVEVKSLDTKGFEWRF